MVVTLRDGRRRGLVSAVNFTDVEFHFVGASFARVSFVQTNYRAYITRGSERSVWFFGTTLSSRLTVFPRLIWGMPWHRVRASLDATWNGAKCVSYESSSSGRWCSSSMRLVPTDEPVGTLDGFENADDAARVIANPLIGYFEHERGGVGRYSVWHEPLQPALGRAVSARFSVFEERGLVEADQGPHSVLLQPSTDFTVLLPPHRVAQGT